MFKDFEKNNLGEYHDLLFQSNTILLAPVLKNFQNVCLEIYELNHPHFLPAPGLVWQIALKIPK